MYLFRNAFAFNSPLPVNVWLEKTFTNQPRSGMKSLKLLTFVLICLPAFYPNIYLFYLVLQSGRLLLLGLWKQDLSGADVSEKILIKGMDLISSVNPVTKLKLILKHCLKFNQTLSQTFLLT